MSVGDDLEDGTKSINVYNLQVQGSATIAGSPVLGLSTLIVPATASGIWAAPIPTTLTFYKIGTLVFMSLPDLSGAETTASFVNLSPSVPAGYIPFNESQFYLSCVDNNSATQTFATTPPVVVGLTGALFIDTSGNMSILLQNGDGNFSGLGNGGWTGTCVCWSTI